ncbi:MAG: carbohydrate ABC transporter permease [Ignavibacteriales bacterium]|jgi:multiple sugar transport system permease protein|nr:MAG: carbohydrate ABC transporter permease [Ignavibacteriaceae bacterium]MBW7873174.1 carbohydrate ABC transporter permease [Ignavibacteria bacterium]MCZ2142816.1 carbohydrate ABC transporter permease [Ignavibacteriales bacterium]OQY79382.1 MAG: sugar ABC transporter permease [Ignavibacteriales bacterium UTCHB3]MBV6443909.1 L-arabinose transport system permease protein AraQ [Ignavibacteriaceae bacterium]
MGKKTLLYGFLIISGFLTLAPFIWMVSASFMLDGHASVFPPRFLPDEFTFDQYKTLFSRLDVSRNLLNSFFLSVVVTLVSLTFNSMAGFAFAKYRFAGKDAIFKMLLSSMVIPAQVTMLPLFLMLKEFGFLNTYMAIIIPGMANVFGIFLIRQFVMAIPDSLIESARIDGANDFQIYYKIIIPLAAPVLVTLAIFTFMGTWNDFLWPLIVLNDSEMYTLPVALANLMGEHTKDPELMMAGSVITILPVMVIFLALQKYYIKGIMMGSVKE